MNTQQTLEKMKSLRLQGMLLAYSSIIESKGHLQLTADELLSMVVDAEWQDRSNKKVKRLTQSAAFRYLSHLSEVNYQASRDLDKELLTRLSSCQFIRQKENVLITGPTGVGKSIIASALGIRLVLWALKLHTTILLNCLQGSIVPKADNSLYRQIARMEKQDLLILDDFGLQNLDKN
jgi:DNA replication protein DnaC